MEVDSRVQPLGNVTIRGVIHRSLRTAGKQKGFVQHLHRRSTVIIHGRGIMVLTICTVKKRRTSHFMRTIEVSASHVRTCLELNIS